MTEDEARTKLCCQKLDIRNRVNKDHKCYASKCMAWRWKSTKQPSACEGTPLKPEGYCGLAGNL